MKNLRYERYKWIVVALLFFATTINYLDRQIIGLLKPTLEQEFNWSESDYAHIVMAFTAAYAIGLLVFGKLIDFLGSKWGYSISVAIWSVAAALHAVARGVGGFVAARIGLGVGEAGNFPAGMKTISEWFSKRETGLVTGIFNAGTSIGVVVALLVVPAILSSYGWQEVFWITGSLGFLWLLCWWGFYRVPNEADKSSIKKQEGVVAGSLATTRGGEKPLKWIRLFAYPQTWAIIAGKLLIDPIYWFFLFWLPAYLSSSFNLDLTKLSPELIIIYGATTVGSIGGGYFSSLLIRKGWLAVKARKFVLLVIAVLEVSIFFTQFVSNIWAVVLIISAAVALHQAWATNIFTLASDLVSKTSVGSVVGIAGMAGAVGGILFPMLIGYLLDLYRLKGNITGGYNILFTICSVSYLTAWVLIHFLTKKAKTI